MGKEPLNAVQTQALNEALNIAMRAKDLDMMVNAVDGGADANSMLFGGMQNLELAWVKAAVEHGADVNATRGGLSSGDVLKSWNPYPVFFWLTRNFDPDIGDYLLSKGAKIDELSREGDSALMAAVRIGDEKVIRYLVERGADPLLVCADQKIPLKEIEDDRSWSDSSRKLPLIKAMVENIKNRRTDAPASPANDVAASKTVENIEISKPIELKRKPQAGFEL